VSGSGFWRAHPEIYRVWRPARPVAEKATGASAEAAARLNLARASSAGGRRSAPCPSGHPRHLGTAPARRLSALDVISVLIGLLVLTLGTIVCAVAGAWAAMVTLLPIGMSLVLVPRRGGRADSRES
jgi:hypothetical protein